MKDIADAKVKKSLEESEAEFRKEEAKEVVKQNISEVNFEYKLQKTPKQKRARAKVKQQKISRKQNRRK